MQPRINTLTALPFLKYLLAEAGVEPPYVPVSTGWTVFQEFLKITAESSEDVAGFQTAWLRENPDAPVLEVLLCRQLTDREPPLGPTVRVVALQFLFDDAPSDFTELELWSKDFRSRDAFLDDVEHRAEFVYAAEAEPSLGDVILVAEDEPPSDA